MIGNYKLDIYASVDKMSKVFDHDCLDKIQVNRAYDGCGAFKNAKRLAIATNQLAIVVH